MVRILLLILGLMASLASTSGLAFASSKAPTGKLELLMVEEDGCAWCERWKKEIGPIYPKSAEGKRAPLRHIDISDPVPGDIKPARGFHFTPTFVVLMDGVEKGRIEGYPGEDFFWGLLSQILASIDQKAASNSN